MSRHISGAKHELTAKNDVVAWWQQRTGHKKHYDKN